MISVQLRQLLLAMALLAIDAARVTGAEENRYLGSEACADCHRAAFDSWRGSHHDLAMQRPTPATVLGDFDDARFNYHGVETRFFRRDDAFWVRTDGPDGKLTDYPVAWVFGVYPLQQYLLPLEDGRLQALSVAWDARPAAEGGQRWYHLYPDEKIDHQDPLHWTGPYQNWNTRCAECHSTNVVKGYDAASRQFSTRFGDEDVGCEACHGPGSAHAARALAGQRVSGPDSALLPLAERGHWAMAEGQAIARRQGAAPVGLQIDTCGRCHARRGTLGEYRHAQPLSDTHRLSLLTPPLYHHDGQILDEVYVYGSFLQSRMHGAGVVCSNCHEPHSNALRAPGNGVCAQCHLASQYDSDQHHHHAGADWGNQCVDCHMPERVYMGVDARRDHSLRVPRPDLSVMIGTPNACNDCHSDQDAQWALNALRDWGVAPSDTADHPALALESLSRGDVRGLPGVLDFAANPATPAIWRATALEQSASAGSVEAQALARSLLDSDEPLLRVSAVRALSGLPLPERYGALMPHRDDPVLGVRLEIAAALAGVPLQQLDAESRTALQKLFTEYLTVQRQHADMPSIQLQLGLFHLARGDLAAADAAYREALRINPQLIAAALNLADLLRGQGREDDARATLQRALATAPGNGDVLHALGLLEARAGNRQAALDLLGRAADAETSGARQRFVYAVALHDFGDPQAALRELGALHRALPADQQTLLALVNYSRESDDLGAARRYLKRLLAIAPDNPAYRQLAVALGGIDQPAD